MKISLSIIIPTLDEAHAIAAMLRALAPLRGRGAEVIVVDGGSTDRTAGLAAPFADLVLTAPRGRARQMNAGAAAARGEVLLFLHADTRLPHAADRLIATALAPPDASWGRFDVTISGRSRWLPLVAALMNLRSRLTGIATGDQALFVRRALFERIGGFPDQPLMEDIELARRLRRVARPVCLTQRVTTSGRRWDARGAVPTILLMWWLRAQYFFGVSPARLAMRYR